MIVTDEGVAIPENGETITPEGAWLSKDGDILIPDELDPDIVMRLAGERGMFMTKRQKQALHY